MRCIGNCLESLPESAVLYFIQCQCQNDGYREAPQQAVQTQKDRVLDHARAVGRREEALEPVKPHPFAARDALAQGIIPESDLRAVHGVILEDQQIRHGREEHDVKRPDALERAERLLTTKRRLFHVYVFLSVRLQIGGRFAPPDEKKVAHPAARFKLRFAPKPQNHAKSGMKITPTDEIYANLPDSG